MKTVLIFGGSGFVGRHIIRRIAKNGHKIIVPHQTQINEAKLRLLGITGQIIPFYFNSLNENKMNNLIKQSDVIINLKTLWDENKISFKKGILEFNISLANKINKLNNNAQFIYFSGLGIDKANNSERTNSILKSEQYVEKCLRNAIIIKPGIIIGGGDQFLKGLLPIFKTSFFIPLFGNGSSKFQPVYVDDLSLATNRIIENKLKGFHIFEFFNLEIFSYKDFYEFIAISMKKTRVFIPVPFFLMKFGVSLLEKTPFSPLNLEQLSLFEKDNIPSLKYKKFDDLGIFPQDIKEIIKNIIKKI